MNKTVLTVFGVVGVLALAAVLLHALPISGDGQFPHGETNGEGESVTIKLNDPGIMTCGQPFFDSIYDLTKKVLLSGRTMLY